MLKRPALALAALFLALACAVPASAQVTVTPINTSLTGLRGIAVRGDGTLFVGLDQEVRTVNPGDGTSTLFSASGRYDVTFDASQTFLYAGRTAGAPTGVVRISAAGAADDVETTLSLPLSLAFDPAGTLHAGYSGGIDRIDVATGIRTNFTANGATLFHGLAFRGTDLLAADRSGSLVFSITPGGTATTFASFAGLGTPTAIALRGGVAYVALTDRQIYTVSGPGATPELLVALPAGDMTQAYDLALSSSDELYVTTDGGTIFRIGNLPAVPTAVPTLMEWAMLGLLMSLALVGAGLAGARRQQAWRDAA